jgi:hypothetical protein
MCFGRIGVRRSSFACRRMTGTDTPARCRQVDRPRTACSTRLRLIDGSPLFALQFPSTLVFTSASFMATLSPTTFMLAHNSEFVAGLAVSATLLPSSGSALVAGIDSPLITTQSAIVPELGTFILVGAALLGTIWRAPRKSRKTAAIFARPSVIVMRLWWFR